MSKPYPDRLPPELTSVNSSSAFRCGHQANTVQQTERCCGPRLLTLVCGWSARRHVDEQPWCGWSSSVGQWCLPAMVPWRRSAAMRSAPAIVHQRPEAHRVPETQAQLRAGYAIMPTHPGGTTLPPGPSGQPGRNAPEYLIRGLVHRRGGRQGPRNSRCCRRSSTTSSLATPQRAPNRSRGVTQGDRDCQALGCARGAAVLNFSVCAGRTSAPGRIRTC